MNYTHKTISLSSATDIKKMSSAISLDISNYLSEDIEELNVYSYEFKSGLERCVSRVLTSLYKQKEKIVLFPESIPGFTLVIFKKIIPTDVINSSIELNSINELPVLKKVMDNFFKKNKQKVLIIDTNDILLALFPIGDTRKNLKEMEMYITF